MSKNLIPEIARMLGVELGEEFKIKGFGELTCTITDDKGLMAADDSSKTGWTPANALFAVLLNDKDEIIKLPWKPKAGEQYYSFGGRFLGDPTVWIVVDVIWQGLAYDVAMFDKGWVYRTKKEAKAALPAVAKELGVEYELND